MNKTTNIIFDELSTLRLPSGSLQTALDKVAAALGSVGDAGQQARQVVDELRASLQAAAVQGVKSARSLAKFDEINRLSAPAAEMTAASAKENQAAQAAAKAAKSTAAVRLGRMQPSFLPCGSRYSPSCAASGQIFGPTCKVFSRRSSRPGRRCGRALARR